MKSKNHDYRVKFDRIDPFMVELRSRVHSKIKERGDHFYAAPADYLKVVIFLLSLGLSYLIFLQMEHGFLRIVMALVTMFSGMLLVAGMAHDASHNRFFKSRKWNQLVMRPLFIVAGLDGKLWGLRHVRSHHPMTNIAGSDCDTNESSIVRMSPRQEWMPHHRYQKYYTPFLYLLIFPHAVWIEDPGHLDEKHIKAMFSYKSDLFDRLSFFFFKGLHFSFWVLIPYLFTDVSFLGCLGYYAIALCFASLLFVCIAVLNHYSEGIPFPEADESGQMGMTYSQHQISVNVDWSPDNDFFTYIFGGANTHVAHHILTDLHSRHLTEATAVIRELSEKYEGYQYTGYPFMEALRSHFRYLAGLGENPHPENGEEMSLLESISRIQL